MSRTCQATRQPSELRSVQRVDFHYPDCLRAERRGGHILVLRSNLDHVPLGPEGETPEYELTYIWLRTELADIVNVQGSEISYWFAHEIDLAKSLFDQLQLFP